MLGRTTRKEHDVGKKKVLAAAFAALFIGEMK